MGEIKVYAALGLVLALLVGGWYYGHCRYDAGAASVRAQWDAAKVAQSAVVAGAQADNAAQSTTWINQFAAAGAAYEATTHAQAPAVADSVAAGVRDGTVRLRGEGECPAVRAGAVSAATARSRAADAAATQALVDRVQAAVAAVRAGDEADARERQLDAQVVGLQEILSAERSIQSPKGK